MFECSVEMPGVGCAGQNHWSMLVIMNGSWMAARGSKRAERIVRYGTTYGTSVFVMKIENWQKPSCENVQFMLPVMRNITGMIVHNWRSRS